MKKAIFIIAMIVGCNPLPAQTKDTVKVSISALDKEIADRTNALNELLKNIEQANKQVIYDQGKIDLLKEKRTEYVQTLKVDTVKTKAKK